MNPILELLKDFDIAAFALVLGLLWILLVIRNAQAGGFSWKRAMQDDNSKESVLRFGIIVALVISSWFLVYVTMNVIKATADLEQLFPYYMAYLAVWSGAKVVEKLLDVLILKFGGKLEPSPLPKPAGT